MTPHRKKIMADATLQYTEGDGAVHYIQRNHVQRITVTPQMDGTSHVEVTVPAGPSTPMGVPTDHLSIGYHDPEAINDWVREFLQAMAGEIIRVPQPEHY